MGINKPPGQSSDCPVPVTWTLPALPAPKRTLGLLAVLAILYWLVPNHELLYFSAPDIAGGEFWRIVTGHFIHADPGHLAWNALGLAVLGTVIERNSGTAWWAALATGIAVVSLFLISPFTRLDYYCGLSGVLNSMLLVAIWLEWRATGSWLMIVVAVGSAAKVIFEISLGTSLLTHISWPPYAWSHLAGLVGGLLVVWVSSGIRLESTPVPDATLD